MDENTASLIQGLLIIGGIIFAIIGAFLIGYEIFTAKQFCIENNGDYKFNFNLPVKHLCDNKEIVKYTDGWFFKEDKDMYNSKVILPKT